MRDILFGIAVVVGLGFLAEYFAPALSFSDVILTGIFIVLFIIMDVLIKVVKALLGGSDNG